MKGRVEPAVRQGLDTPARPRGIRGEAAQGADQGLEGGWQGGEPGGWKLRIIALLDGFLNTQRASKK